MKRILILAALFLAACGGGGDAPAAAPPVVAPPPVATPPPVAAVPAGTKFTAAPITARAGNLVWVAGGMTYGLIVADFPSAGWVALLSASSTGANVTLTAGELIADGMLDLRPPLTTDAETRIYVNTVLLPKLNEWFAANSSRFASGFTAGPVSAAEVKSGAPMDRLAARLPQLIELTAAGFVLKP